MPASRSSWNSRTSSRLRWTTATGSTSGAVVFTPKVAASSTTRATSAVSRTVFAGMHPRRMQRPAISPARQPTQPICRVHAPPGLRCSRGSGAQNAQLDLMRAHRCSFSPRPMAFNQGCRYAGASDAQPIMHERRPQARCMVTRDADGRPCRYRRHRRKRRMICSLIPFSGRLAPSQPPAPPYSCSPRPSPRRMRSVLAPTAQSSQGLTTQAPIRFKTASRLRTRAPKR